MNRLEAIKRRVFVEASSIVEVEDVEVLDWNKSLIVDENKPWQLKIAKLPSFPNWLFNIEKVDVKSSSNEELSVLFDKYALYLIGCSKKMQLNSYSYVSVISYIEGQKKRLTNSSKRSKSSNDVIELNDYQKFYSECCGNVVNQSEQRTKDSEAIQNAHNVASLFKNN